MSGHGGLWSDNSIAMLGALFRIQFPLNGANKAAISEVDTAPKMTDVSQ